MKILNLYSGIGGNRKLWGSEHDIVAVEKNKQIADIYQDFFPEDEIVIDDAHSFLLHNFQEFDFIWSSPPCPSHSITNHFLKGLGLVRYPDMQLYEEIILLQYNCKTKYVVENVKSYYDPLVRPQDVGRHYFWSNFHIPQIKMKSQIGIMHTKASLLIRKKNEFADISINSWQSIHGFNLDGKQLENKRQVLRNCVVPELGKHVFDSAFKITQTRLVK